MFHGCSNSALASLSGVQVRDDAPFTLDVVEDGLDGLVGVGGVLVLEVFDIVGIDDLCDDALDDDVVSGLLGVPCCELLPLGGVELSSLKGGGIIVDEWMDVGRLFLTIC